MILSQDITSLFNPEVAYGKRGDSVLVISYHGSVAIVENLDGKRFPMQAALLSGKITMNENDEFLVHTEIDTVEKKPEPKTRAKKPNKIIVADERPTLF